MTAAAPDTTTAVEPTDTAPDSPTTPNAEPRDAAALRDELAKARESLRAAELRRSIDRELFLAGAIDLGSAALLTEAAVSGMSAPDAAAAVRELKRRRPGLFRAATPPGGASMGPAIGPGDSDADRALAAASATGDRKALLHYLRARRIA